MKHVSLDRIGVLAVKKLLRPLGFSHFEHCQLVDLVLEHPEFRTRYYKDDFWLWDTITNQGHLYSD